MVHEELALAVLHVSFWSAQEAGSRVEAVCRLHHGLGSKDHLRVAILPSQSESSFNQRAADARAVRLLSDLAAGDVLAEEMLGKLAGLRSDARAMSPNDLQRYAEAIDWGRQHDPIVVQRLALVLLRITVGLARELESFQHTAKG